MFIVSLHAITLLIGVTFTNEVWLKYITSMRMFVEVQICKSEDK